MFKALYVNENAAECEMCVGRDISQKGSFRVFHYNKHTGELTNMFIQNGDNTHKVFSTCTSAELAIIEAMDVLASRNAASCIRFQSNNRRRKWAVH